MPPSIATRRTCFQIFRFPTSWRAIYERYTLRMRGSLLMPKTPFLGPLIYASMLTSVIQRAFSYMSDDEVKQTSRNGFAIELHTHSHSLADFSFAKVREEISMNREVLSRLLNLPPTHFRHLCYPSGIEPPDGGEPFRHLGILSATTTRPGIAYRGTDLMLLPRIIDGNHLSELEFEGEVCGVGDFLRKTRALGSNIFAGGRSRFARDHQAGMP